MQQLMNNLSEITAEIRIAFENVEVGEDPIHDVIKELSSQKEAMKKISGQLSHHLPGITQIWFFTQTGLSQEGGVFSEIIRRLEERMLPPIPPINDILWSFGQVLSDRDREWMEKITPSQLGRLLSFFAESVKMDESFFTEQLQKSIEILAQRIAGLGLDPIVSARLRDKPDLLAHFLELGDLSFAAENFGDSPVYLEALKNCERSLLYVRGRREFEGTSLGLTYRLVHIEELIYRLKMILNVTTQFNTSYKLSALAVLYKQILISHLEKRRVRKFLGRNIEILAYQVTLLTGNTGEHYITSTGRELRAMWWKAIKGGMVVACLVVIKVVASKAHLAPLPQAFVYGLIYATGFVVIHLVGGVLATKQPSMTASTLAAALGSGDQESERDLKGLVDVIVRTLRTQLAALFGNYLTAFPIAIMIVFPFLVWGHPIASEDKAQSMLRDLHPFMSLSFVYAAIAGVCLFVSGMVCGLADNWFDFNQIAQRMESIFPGPRGVRVANYFRKNFGIWTSNITLGFMLGSMSSIGLVVGLPLDIRHVTFASGQFGIAWIHQPEMMAWDRFVLFAASIFVMGLINLAVSFSLSLLVAMKSRRLRFSQGGTLVWLLLKKILTSPQELFMAKE
jgi:site-specific recombinase